MHKIFIIIFAIAAVAGVGAAPPELLGEADAGIQSAKYDEADALAKMFRLSWRNSRTALTLFFSPAVPELSAKDQVQPTLAEFDSPFDYDGNPLTPLA